MAEEKSKRAKLYTGSLLTQTEFISRYPNGWRYTNGNELGVLAWQKVL